MEITTAKFYDIAFIGHYTKDTIVSASGIIIINGGAFNYGANVVTRMGLKIAAIKGETRGQVLQYNKVCVTGTVLCHIVQSK